MSCLYTNRKSTVATKMGEALPSNGGKILIGAADTGRFSSTGIQTETKANWQYFRQPIPSEYWVWINVMPFDDIGKKPQTLNLYLLDWWYWKCQKIIHRGLERFKILSSSELGGRKEGIQSDWGIMTGRRAEREAEAHNIGKPKKLKVKEQTMWDVLAENNRSRVHNDVSHWTVGKYLEVFQTWAGYLIRPRKEW